MADRSLPMDSANRSLAISQLLATCVDAVFLAAVVFIGRLLQPRVEIAQTFAMAAIGYSLGIASVSGLSMSLGPQSRLIRVPLTPLIAMCGFFLTVIAMAVSGASREQIAVGAVVLSLAVTVQFLAVQSPYWLMRSRWKFQIAHERKIKVSDRVRSLQFSTLHLLIVVTIAAIALGVGRWAIDLAAAARKQGDAGLQMAADCGLLLGYNALVAWTLAWAALSPSATLWKLAAAFAFTSLLLVSVSSILPTMSLGPPRSLFWLLYAPQPAFHLTHLFAVRLCGYRLVRNLAIDS